MKFGYTLVELLIIVSIVGILLSFSLSGYSKSQERQLIQQTKEELLSKLQTYQKAAYAGDRDCGGPLLDIKVTFTASSMTAVSECSGTPATGTPEITNFNSITFTTSPIIYFRPLIQGTTVTTANLDYLLSGNTYRIVVSQPGTITYQGLIP